MSLTEILTRKDADPAEQLKEVAEVVAVARKAYGNEDAEIAAPACETTEGRMKFNHLEPAGQVALLRKQLSLVKAQAVEFAETTAGASVDKKIEELLATNAYFAHSGQRTKFAYI